MVAPLWPIREGIGTTRARRARTNLHLHIHLQRWSRCFARSGQTTRRGGESREHLAAKLGDYWFPPNCTSTNPRQLSPVETENQWPLPLWPSLLLVTPHGNAHQLGLAQLLRARHPLR